MTSTTYSDTISTPGVTISKSFSDIFGATAGGVCNTFAGEALCNPSVSVPEFSKTLSITVPTGIDETCLTSLLGDSISAVVDFGTTYATGPLAGLATGLEAFLDASSSGFSNVFAINSFEVAPIALTGSDTTLSATLSFTLLGTAYTDQVVTLPLGADVTALASILTDVVEEAFTAATNLVG